MSHGIRLKENKHSKRNMVKHHHQVHQILYVLENTGEIIFNDKKHSFAQDSLVFIPPFSDHAIVSDAKMTVFALEFNLEKLDGDVKHLLCDQQCFNETRLIKLTPFEAANVRQLLRRMLYEQSQEDMINLLAVKIYVEELLLIVLRTQKRSNIINANVLRAEMVREYLDTHYFDIGTANDISQKLGISSRHVNTIFKERYDMTPMHYLNEVRMEISKKLLMETDNDIASICFEVGFEAISTFYRRFKEYTHLSPNKFRLEHQNADFQNKKD